MCNAMLDSRFFEQALSILRLVVEFVALRHGVDLADCGIVCEAANDCSDETEQRRSRGYTCT